MMLIKFYNQLLLEHAKYLEMVGKQCTVLILNKMRKIDYTNCLINNSVALNCLDGELLTFNEDTRFHSNFSSFPYIEMGGHQADMTACARESYQMTYNQSAVDSKVQNCVNLVEHLE